MLIETIDGKLVNSDHIVSYEITGCGVTYQLLGTHTLPNHDFFVFHRDTHRENCVKVLETIKYHFGDPKRNSVDQRALRVDIETSE